MPFFYSKYFTQRDEVNITDEMALLVSEIIMNCDEVRMPDLSRYSNCEKLTLSSLERLRVSLPPNIVHLEIMANTTLVEHSLKSYQSHRESKLRGNLDGVVEKYYTVQHMNDIMQRRIENERGLFRWDIPRFVSGKTLVFRNIHITQEYLCMKDCQHATFIQCTFDTDLVFGTGSTKCVFNQ